VWQLGKFDEVAAILQEADQIAHVLGDRRRLSHVALSMYNLFWIVGRHEEQWRLLGQVQAAAASTDDVPAQLVAVLQLGQTGLSTGDVLSTRELLASRLRLADDGSFSDDSLRRVQLRAVLALSHAYTGEFREGIARGDEAMAIADSVGTAFTRSYVSLLFASLHAWKGDFATALSLSEHGSRLAEAQKVIPLLSPMIATQGWASCGVGQAHDGIPLLQKGIEIAESRRVMYWHTNLLVMLAEGYGLAGDMVGSRQTAARALDCARARREPGFEAWSHCLLGASAIGEHLEPDFAEQHFRVALTLAEPLRLRPLVARCHLGVGRLFRRTGNRPRAQEHLNLATAMLSDMDMRFWLTQAEAETRALA
jgi:hypothetical protein